MTGDEVFTSRNAEIRQAGNSARPASGRHRAVMPSTHKKVIVRKMDRDTVSGYVSPAQFVHEGKLEAVEYFRDGHFHGPAGDQGRLFCAGVRRLGVVDAQDVHFPSAVGRVVGAPAIQRQRDSRRR